MRLRGRLGLGIRKGTGYYVFDGNGLNDRKTELLDTETSVTGILVKYLLMQKTSHVFMSLICFNFSILAIASV